MNSTVHDDDEILSVGDNDFREKSSEALMRRFQDGRTVVLVSHDEKSIERLCDRAIWIENGRTVSAGPVREVMAAYRASSPAPGHE